VRALTDVTKGLGLSHEAERDLTRALEEWMAAPDPVAFRSRTIRGLRSFSPDNYAMRNEIWRRAVSLYRSMKPTRPDRTPQSVVIQKGQDRYAVNKWKVGEFLRLNPDPDGAKRKDFAREIGVSEATLWELIASVRRGKTERIPGGRAKGLSPEDFPPEALAQGTHHELEHTADRALAMEIAMDRLAEDTEHYTKLKQVEKAENGWEPMPGIEGGLRRSVPGGYEYRFPPAEEAPEPDPAIGRILNASPVTQPPELLFCYTGDDEMYKGGPYIGPRGGKWADAAHTIPWHETDQPSITDKVKALIADHKSPRGKFKVYPSESMLERAGIDVKIPQHLSRKEQWRWLYEWAHKQVSSDETRPTPTEPTDAQVNYAYDLMQRNPVGFWGDKPIPKEKLRRMSRQQVSAIIFEITEKSNSPHVDLLEQLEKATRKKEDPDDEIVIRCRGDAGDTLARMLRYMQKIAHAGASRAWGVMPYTQKTDPDYTQTFGIDGDGADKITEVKLNGKMVKALVESDLFKAAQRKYTGRPRAEAKAEDLNKAKHNRLVTRVVDLVKTLVDAAVTASMKKGGEITVDGAKIVRQVMADLRTAIQDPEFAREQGRHPVDVKTVRGFVEAFCQMRGQGLAKSRFVTRDDLLEYGRQQDLEDPGWRERLRAKMTRDWLDDGIPIEKINAYFERNWHEGQRLIVKSKKILVVRRVKDPKTGEIREVPVVPGAKPKRSKARGGPFIGPRGGKWADAAHTIPWKPEMAEAPPTRVEPAPAKVTPGTRVKWSGLTGWMQARDLLVDRNIKPSVQGYKNIETHVKLDLAAEIAREKSPAVVRKYLGNLKEIKRGTLSTAIRQAIAANQVLANKRLAELSQKKRPTVPKKKPSEPGWERMPEPEPRLVVPSKKKQEVTAAMAKKKTKGQRKKANETALDIVQRAVAEGRGLTDEEAIQVAGYTGKGGISGDLNQFYTPVKVAEAMWTMMESHMDRPPERVLEPSCGSGVFLQTAPVGAKVTGVELDSSAAAVADALHGHKHEIHTKAFEEFTIENMGKPLDFDAVIANPPYVKRTGDIPLHKAEYKSADKYFIDTSLDHAKDGGVIALLIHPGVMNNTSPGWKDFREHLLARAEIVDGFRLPDTTFKHTHCGIPADILIMKKRDKHVGAALQKCIGRGGLEPVLTHFDAWDQDWVDGTYFDKRPERILGEVKTREETGFRDTVEGDIETVPAAMRKLTEAKIAKPTEPAARAITLEQLVKLGDENEAVKKNISDGAQDVAAAERPPVIGQTQIIARQRYLYIGDPPTWQLMETVDDVSQIITQTGDEAIKSAHDIALDIAALIRSRDNGEYYAARNMRRITADRVKAWVAEHGIPGSHKALAALSKSAPQLLDFMACVNSAGELSDALSKDAAVTLKPAEVDRTDLLGVANYIARRNRGYVTEDDIQHNWEGWESESKDEIRKMLLATGQYCLDSTATVDGKPVLQHVEDYLTGNLWEKLEKEKARLEELEGEEKAQTQRQIATIRERLDTKRRSIDDVPIQLRVMNWMPLEWFSEWLNTEEGKDATGIGYWLGYRRARMHYEKGVYVLQKVVGEEGYTRREWVEDPDNPGRMRMREIHSPEGTMLEQTPGTFDFLRYMNRLTMGKGSKEKAEDVEKHIEERFSEWLKNSNHREELEDLYNRTFNSEFKREYSGDPLELEGIREGIIPHDFQNQAVRWASETGRGILAQDVGLGKTFIAILLARLRKQNGQARRPFVVVPKSVATNWAEEVDTLFPNSKVLIIGETRYQSGKLRKKAEKQGKELGLKGKELKKYAEENSWTTRSDTDIERNRKLAQVKQNEYDLIICTKPAFDRIPMKRETTEEYAKDEFDYQRAEQLHRIGQTKKTTEAKDKAIERLKATFAQEKLAEKFKYEESLVHWEDMGIDCLIADEAHAYKNLHSARSRYGHDPKFLGGSSDSKQAHKMEYMSKYVRDSSPGNSVYFLTATPTKNSPLEVYNMLQHIAPEEFRKIGINNSEEFIDRFCKIEERLILAPPGRAEAEAAGGKKKRDFDDEDKTQYKEEWAGCGDLVSAMCVTGFTNLKELEPLLDKYCMIQTATDVGLKIPDANHKEHLVDMTQEQEDIYESLRQEAESAKPKEDPGALLRVFDQMKKAAQDLELYNPEKYQGWYEKSPKYKAAVDAAYDGAMERGGQLIFCDHNASHARLKAMLMDKGLKEHEIGIINAQVAKDSEARQQIGNRFNRNEIKVVIGNTGTMGEGVNLQGKKHEAGTTDIHHLDQPWDPGTMHQRNGRGVRQGNKAEQVNVHWYLAKGSFDGFRYSTLKGKERWLDKLRSGANDISNDMEGQDIGEIERMAMMSKDPEAAMAKIRQMRSAAEGKWYAKQTADAVTSFYNWQKKHERIRRMKKESESKAKLVTETDRLKRQLLRNELLPQEIKDHLNSGDTSPVASVMFMSGEGESARFAAKIIRPGEVVEYGDTKYVVTGVNMLDQTVSVRQWGFAEKRTANASQLHDALPTTYHETDELKEKLRDTLDEAWRSPLTAIDHISEATLEANRDLIDETMRQWTEKHGERRGDKLILVRTSEGNIGTTTLENMGEAEIVYPWGRDKADLVEALVASNTKKDYWDVWSNTIIAAGKSTYGMSSYEGGPFTDLVDRAKAVWKERRAAA
jgi:predicted RNA methylase/superfamily II DNA or RNA helicase